MKNYLVKEETINYTPGSASNALLCKVEHSTPHFHRKSLELVYCLRGEVCLVTGEQRVILHETQIFSVDANEIHYISNYGKNDNLLLIFHLDLTRLGCFFNDEPIMFTCESTHVFPYQTEAMNTVKDLILALSAAHFNSNISAVCSSAENRLIETLRKYFDWYNHNNHDEYINPDLHSRFYNSFSYCMKHYKDKITASELAEREHLNPNYLSQFLTTTVFKSFSSMVKYVRCFRAHHLLLETNMPNYEIAYSVGFSDPKYFYSAFHEWWGCSPKDARNDCNAHMRAYLADEKNIEIINDNNALEIIKDYMAEWHMKKYLSD